MNSVKKYVAEFIGTFVLVLVACGTACVTGCIGAGYLTTALAFGLVIVAMAYSIGNVSGCHINPAVSIAMLISKKMSVIDFVGYVVAQCLGALAGAGVLKYIFNGEADLTGALGSNALYQDSIAKSIVIEILLTFVFVIAILGVTSKVENGTVAGLVIGGSLTLVHLIGIGLTGTSVNPARSLGPALLAGGEALSNVWVFILAPLVGGALAAVVYMFLDSKKK